MKKLKKYAADFLRKKAAEKGMDSINPDADSFQTDVVAPSYDALSFITCYANTIGVSPEQVLKSGIVEVINLCNIHSTANIGNPAFAIRNANGSYFWTRIGSNILHLSGKNAYIYNSAPTFRLTLKDKETRRIVAACELNNGIVYVKNVFDVVKVPDGDNEYSREIPLGNSLANCKFEELLSFVKHL